MINYRHDQEEASHLAPDYCGNCYGADPPPGVKKAGCCNTCSEVRDAYALKSWSFGKGENVEQCQREHYGEQLEQQKHEGCRIQGSIRVNKVAGNFHFAPGKSFSNGMMHMHDLEVYLQQEAGVEHDFSHKIHELRFGPELPESVVKKVGRKGVSWSNHHLNPLDNIEQEVDDKDMNFMYFVKVVSTAYLPLGWNQKKTTMQMIGVDHEETPLGAWGHGDDGSIETHQYSVTSHKRNVQGGDDSAQGHKERIHARGGIPGVFFSYVSFD